MQFLNSTLYLLIVLFIRIGELVSLLPFLAMTFFFKVGLILSTWRKKNLRKVRKLRKNWIIFLTAKKKKIQIKSAKALVYLKKVQKRLKRSITYFISFRYLIGGVACLLVIFLIVAILNSVPNPKTGSDFSRPASTLIYDRSGILLYTAYNKSNFIPVTYNTIPQTVIDATLAAEDKSFFSHSGFDFPRIVKVFFTNLTTKQVQGASTITQQLAKNAFLSGEKTFTRKIKEALIAINIERNFTKKEILELYFNTVSYGGNTIGIESASQRYFGKKTQELTKKEAVFLASLPVAPSVILNSPTRQVNYKQRMAYILDQMVEMKKLSPDGKKTIEKQALNILSIVEYKRAPYFVDYVLQKLTDMYGKEYLLEHGFTVRTSVDLQMQNYAQMSLLEQIQNYKGYNITNGAILIVNPQNGEILTMVGSANYFDPEWGQFNVVTSPRQLGSALKLITYATALEKGKYSPDTLVADKRRFFKEYPTYKPRNYDGKEHGTVTIREAFANSYNLPALNIAYELGVDQVAEMGVKLGIPEFDIKKEELPLSIVLGGVETTLEHATQAYAVIANDGAKVDIDPFIQIKDYQGKVFYEKKSAISQNEKQQIISPKTARQIFTILSDSNARMAMFGSSSQFYFNGEKIAIKTGTSDNTRDNTAFAFNDSFVIGTWMGNNDNSPMYNVASGYVGATSIMHDVALKMIEQRNKNTISANTDVKQSNKKGVNDR